MRKSRISSQCSWCWVWKSDICLQGEKLWKNLNLSVAVFQQKKSNRFRFLSGVIIYSKNLTWQNYYRAWCFTGEIPDRCKYLSGTGPSAKKNPINQIDRKFKLVQTSSANRNPYKKVMVVSRQPTLINLKSNTMKNTMQM